MANNTPSNNELHAWLMSLKANQVQAMKFSTSTGGLVKRKMGKNTATNVIQTQRQYVINKFKGKNGQANLGRQRNRRPPNTFEPGVATSRNTQEALGRVNEAAPRPPVNGGRKGINLGGVARGASKAAVTAAFFAAPVATFTAMTAAPHVGRAGKWVAGKLVSSQIGNKPTEALSKAGGALFSGKTVPEASILAWNTLPNNQRKQIANLAANKFKYVLGSENRSGYIRNLTNTAKTTIANKNVNKYKQNLMNKGFLVLSNYLAEQIGYKENANTRKIDGIVKKLISLKNAVANTKSQQNKYNYGYQMGELIGDLIVAYGKLPAGSGKYRNLSNGAIAGVLDHVFNKNTSNKIRRVIVVARNQNRSSKFVAPFKVAAEHAGAVASAGLAAYSGNYNSALRGAGLHFAAPTTQNRFNLIASTQGPEAALQDWASGQLISLGTTKLKNTARYLFNTYLETHSARPGENQATFLQRIMRNAKKAATNQAALGIVAGRTAGRMARNAAASASASAVAAGRGVASLWRGGNKPKENVYLY
jgi:hypothetical protein